MTRKALSIQSRSAVGKIELVKEFARGLGLNPEAILIKHAFTEPDTKYINPQQQETEHIRSLMTAIKSELTGNNPHQNYQRHKIRIGDVAAGRKRT